MIYDFPYFAYILKETTKLSLKCILVVLTSIPRSDGGAALDAGNKKKKFTLILFHTGYKVVLSKRVFTKLYIYNNYYSLNFVPSCELCKEYGK